MNCSCCLYTDAFTPPAIFSIYYFNEGSNGDCIRSLSLSLSLSLSVYLEYLHRHIYTYLAYKST